MTARNPKLEKLEIMKMRFIFDFLLLLSPSGDLTNLLRVDNCSWQPN